MGQDLEAAALRATDRAASRGSNDLKAAMSSAGLGGLSKAIAAGSDLQKGGRVKRVANGGFSVSGFVRVRGRSERTIGAIDTYLGAGADIRPKRGGWLWIPSRDIPARVGRYRMTPSRYRDAGLEQRLGPLVEVPGRKPNERLLVVQRVTVSGRKGSARKVSKTGRMGKGRELRDVVVAFIGIRSTSRQARVNPDAIFSAVQARLPDLIADEFGRR